MDKQVFKNRSVLRVTLESKETLTPLHLETLVEDALRTFIARFPHCGIDQPKVRFDRNATLGRMAHRKNRRAIPIPDERS